MATKKEYSTSDSKAGCDVCMVNCMTMEGCIGDTSAFGYLCLPEIPCLSKGGTKPPLFMPPNAKLPLFMSIFMGLQHCLAMLAGIFTSGGSLIGLDACQPWQKDPTMCSHRSFLISTAWITCGILTIVQVFRAKLCGGYYLGTGLISVMGTSFTFLPIAREMTMEAFYDARASGEPTDGTAMIGYGKFLGTCLVASLFEIVIAFLPRKIRKQIFPPIVVGIAVMMIGAGLIGAGIKYLGGGVFCGENMISFPTTMLDHGFNFARKKGTIKCNENGGVLMQFGAPEYVLMGSGVVAFGTLIQIFGSPFFKSTFIFWSLMFGVIVSAVATKDGNSYWNLGPGSAFDKAPAFVFLWSQTTFPLGFDGAYFLPLLICYWVTAAETYGDVQMTAYYSRIYTPGPDGEPTTEEEKDELDAHIQGGLLADGINSFLACLAGSPPNTTFSQNNGVIALTRCASRSAGFSCGIWLIIFGIFGKVGGFFASIPICIVGGVVLQCFCMVFVAGLGMLADAGVGKENNRRASYIAMVAIAFGVGVALEPQIFDAGVTSPSAFYHVTSGFNYGLWPKYLVCDSIVKRSITTPSSCVPYTGPTVKGGDADQCTTLNGTYTASSTLVLENGPYCSDNFGQNIIKCCNGWNKSAKAFRTTVIIMLKTPYCIAPLIALILHLIVPYDKVLDDDETPSGKAEKAEA